MKNNSMFTVVLMGIFAVLLIGGVITFATYSSESSEEQIGQVDIWGSYDRAEFDQFLGEIKKVRKGFEKVKYKEFSKDDFDQEVLEALASGNSPDLLFIDETQMAQYLNKTFTFTAESYSRRVFQENFVELAEVYFQNDGIVALPLAADPVVMYWNRDLFASAGLAQPPKSWPDFFDLASELSIVDESLNVRQSTIAFGETRNVNYFREILATLMFQIGNPVITNTRSGQMIATLRGDESIESASPVLRFFTEFSDASKGVYSWNRSLPSARDQFLGGKLAVYFAPASEIATLRKKNPNLNFAIAEIPAVDEDVSRRKAVHARLYGFMVPRASDNIGGAFRAAVDMTNTQNANIFSNISRLAPVRRDLVNTVSNEVYQDVLKTEAIYARTFIDPNEVSTNGIFSRMIEYITSGQRSIDESISVSNAELNELLEK